MQPVPIIAANVRAYSDALRGAGVSYTDQAKRCLMSKGQFSEMRGGKWSAPGIWTCVRLAEGLGVDLGDLVTTNAAQRDAVCMRLFRGGARRDG